MKKLVTLFALAVFVLNGFSQETHFGFSVTNSTGYNKALLMLIGNRLILKICQ